MSDLEEEITFDTLARSYDLHSENDSGFFAPQEAAPRSLFTSSRIFYDGSDVAETKQPSALTAFSDAFEPISPADDHLRGPVPLMRADLKRSVQANLQAGFCRSQPSLPVPADPSAAASQRRPFVPAPGSGAREAPTVSSGIQLMPVNVLPDQYRSVYPFSLFNAVQSACFDTVCG